MERKTYSGRWLIALAVIGMLTSSQEFPGWLYWLMLFSFVDIYREEPRK